MTSNVVINGGSPAANNSLTIYDQAAQAGRAITVDGPNITWGTAANIAFRTSIT